MKTKAHTRYKTKDGKRVPGVTTITGELGWNKQVLIKWANNLGLKGIDSSKYVDDKASIGSLAHDMILCYHQGKEVDKSDYSENQIKQAENSLLSYYEWLKGKTLKPILLEKPLVSEIHHFGGTPDNYCNLDGKLTLLDYKTGKGIYPEYSVQVGGGYQILLEENGHKVEQVAILNIPRTEDESFQYKIITDIEACELIFLSCLITYRTKKRIGG